MSDSTPTTLNAEDNFWNNHRVTQWMCDTVLDRHGWSNETATPRTLRNALRGVTGMLQSPRDGTSNNCLANPKRATERKVVTQGRGAAAGDQWCVCYASTTDKTQSPGRQTHTEALAQALEDADAASHRTRHAAVLHRARSMQQQHSETRDTTNTAITNATRIEKAQPRARRNTQDTVKADACTHGEKYDPATGACTDTAQETQQPETQTSLAVAPGTHFAFLVTTCAAGKVTRRRKEHHKNEDKAQWGKRKHTKGMKNNKHRE
ncbi:hypothetical protein TRVL_08340 [Trypanosoma vivax]|nr:hypothetical protein TRVL_08340 [Trypanosoma vivax]